nr:MAG TPA: Protein of unknown function (DUF1270) [Caudoviricetes sp.]
MARRHFRMHGHPKMSASKEEKSLLVSTFCFNSLSL